MIGIGMALFLQTASAPGGTLIAFPSNDPVLLDGRCGKDEYGRAAARNLGRGVTLYALHDEHYLSLCADLPPESLGTLDLYLRSGDDALITNLHISAQVGERTYREGENPEWQWGNHRGWYGPPVAFSGTAIRPDGRAQATFADAKGREIRLSKARFGQGPWEVRLELHAIGPVRANMVRLPAKEGDWLRLSLRPPGVETDGR